MSRVYAIKEYIRGLVPLRIYGWYAALRRVLARLRYWGDVYECPFCGKHFRQFRAAGSTLPVWREKGIVGGGWRENALCLWCDSVDRERMIYLFLKKHTDLFLEKGKVKKVLHIAPETNLGRVVRSSPHVEYVGGDLNTARPYVTECLDITDIQYPDNTFDIVICSNVLEHVPDDRRAMRECYRVLKTSGFAILQVPLSLRLAHTFEDWSVATSDAREQVFGQSDHVRIYARDYIERLESAGFWVVEYSAEKEFGSAMAERYALPKEELLCVGYKEDAR